MTVIPVLIIFMVVIFAEKLGISRRTQWILLMLANGMLAMLNIRNAFKDDTALYLAAASVSIATLGWLFTQRPE